VKQSLEDLAAENRLQKTQIEGLEQALYIEQDKRKKGKTLFGEIRALNKSGSLWFSPGGVQQAIDIQEAREEAKQAAIKAKKAARTAKAIENQQRAFAKQQSLLDRQDQRQKKALELENWKTLQQRLKEAQQANKQLQDDIHIVAKTPQKAQKDKQPIAPVISSLVLPSLAEQSDLVTTRFGRQSKPSLRRRAL
jgi:heterodisulfide reductase subunit A-like polyferredoxin